MLLDKFAYLPQVISEGREHVKMTLEWRKSDKLASFNSLVEKTNYQVSFP